MIYFLNIYVVIHIQNTIIYILIKLKPKQKILYLNFVSYLHKKHVIVKI